MRNSTNPYTCIAHMVIKDTKPCHGRAVADEPLSRRKYLLCETHLMLIGLDSKRPPVERTIIKHQVVKTNESSMLRSQLEHANDLNKKLREQVSELLQERADAWTAKRETRQPVPVDGTVYFLRIGGYIKIGWTSDLDRRMKAYPPDTVLLATMPGTRSDELREHKRFAHLRTHGREWYPLAPQITERIAALVRAHGEPVEVTFAAMPVKLSGVNTKQSLRVKSWR